MLKNNFFQFQPVKLSLISDILNKELAIETDLDFDQVIFDDINTIKNSQAKSLTFFSNIKYKENLLSAKPLGVIINKKYLSYVSHIPVKIVTDNPYYIYSQILPLFVKSKTNKHNFSSNNNISPSAKIGENCQIGSNIVIEDEVAIGNNVTIGHGVVIKRGVRIGDNVHIEGNNILQYCVVGKGSTIGSGTNIGQRGFGFAFHQGHHYEVAQVGMVEIGNNVNIGSNVAIDRGAVDNTVIGDNAIIDNLVQIAHNVTIGKGAVIVAQSGIAGSTIIGDYTMLGGQAGIAGHLKIGKQVQIAAQSGVIKDVGDKEIVGGYPAVRIKDWHKQSIILKQLSKVFKKFNKWVK